MLSIYDQLIFTVGSEIPNSSRLYEVWELYSKCGLTLQTEYGYIVKPYKRSGYFCDVYDRESRLMETNIGLGSIDSYNFTVLTPPRRLCKPLRVKPPQSLLDRIIHWLLH